MLKNIGKYIRILAIVLAIVSFLGFAALGTWFLLAALEEGISEELWAAGIQAAAICYVLCVITPFLNLLIYGFGALISTVQSQAEDNKKTKEILQAALSDGLLAEEIARKSGQVQAMLLERMMAQAPAPASKKPSRAPVQRPVKESAPAPAAKAPVAEIVESPAQSPAPVKEEPAAPLAEPAPLQLLSVDEETF